MKIIKSSIKRSDQTTKELKENVSEIIENVRENGDNALLHYNERFDKTNRKYLRVSKEEIEQAYKQVSKEDIEDILKAAKNIREFAKVQKETIRDLPAYVISPGAVLGHKVIPVRSCCCYVPGGGYPLYSSAMMLAIPAKVAGVNRVTACSPVMKGTNKIHPKTLVSMDISGVDEIYALGGAHAIAAFSYGTEQIKPVDLIVGPGNRYVAEAKRQCYGQVGIDFVAGPSEVLIIADHTADADIIAMDVLSQSEHDLVAKGIVITTDVSLGEEILNKVDKHLEELETAEIARESWDNYGEIIIADSIEEAINISNEYAPEHLEIQVDKSEKIVEKLHNYGSLFIGKYTAEVFGDYASGTNHTLPTLKAARYTGGVYVGTFLKTCTHQSYTVEAMREMAPLVSRLARGEGLIAHARSAELRLEKWSEK